MHHVSADPPPFFHRGPSPLARLAFFVVVSIALMFADTRFQYLERHPPGAAVVLVPRAARGADARRGAGLARRLLRVQAGAEDENANLKRGARDADAGGAGGQPPARREREPARAARHGQALRQRRPSPPRCCTPGATRSRRSSSSTRAATPASRRATPVIDELRRRGPGHPRVPEHGGGHAGHRQGPGGAGEGRAQRRAQRRRSARARAARPSCGSWRPTPTSSTATSCVTSGIDGTYPAGPCGGAGRRRSSARPGRCSRRIAVKPLAGADRSVHLLVLSQAR